MLLPCSRPTYCGVRVQRSIVLCSQSMGAGQIVDETIAPSLGPHGTAFLHLTIWLSRCWSMPNLCQTSCRWVQVLASDRS